MRIPRYQILVRTEMFFFVRLESSAGLPYQQLTEALTREDGQTLETRKRRQKEGVASKFLWVDGQKRERQPSR